MEKTALLLIIVMIASCISFASCDNTDSPATQPPPPPKTPDITVTTPTATTASVTATPTAAATEIADINAMFVAMTSNDDAAIALFNTSMTTVLKTVPTYKLSLNAQEKHTSAGFSTGINFTASGAVVGFGTDSVKARAYINAYSDTDGEHSVDIYNENGYSYYTFPNNINNYKVKESIDSFISVMTSFEISSITSADCEASRLVENNDSTKTAYIKFNCKQADDFMDSAISGGLLGEETGYLYLTMTADASGKPVLLTYTFHMDTTEEGVPLTHDVTYTSTYSYDNVSVTAPEGYESY